ncbi:hypothetical protein [Hymenobacter weizhouensis]|uniref:hypothetical protein n=1 Tax=Hymenobacter sp. YIM 151500-1 TaxID=2987689 RepID=UPI002226213A|nr:hypothetical protein [Hymenobacter sp. YIM 151500-1]UYZ61723.1 hypothetical protein OIS53_11995 [Hymenobacter sp. YIM 151500-1]
MRFFAAWLLLPVCMVSLVACSEHNSASSEQPVTSTISIPDTLIAKPQPTPEPAPAPAVTAEQEVAAYLAGLPVAAHSTLQPLTTQPAWQAYAQEAAKSWTTYHDTRTAKIEQWAATELDTVRAASPTVFYPFSGPDFLNVTTMFPGSRTYVLMGLEPVGSVPRPATLQNPKLFTALKASLWSVLSFSFFRTNDMAVELKSVELDGALPLLLLFAARTDHHVTGLRYVQLTPDGQLQAADSTAAPKSTPKIIPGVELKLQSKAGLEKTVLYFSADLSDWKLGTTQQAPIKYVRSLGPLATYVKSATYLMHKLYFSKVRNLILERSNYILQDDSGIAMKYFRPAEWQLTYYGTYKRPINLFAKHYQPELTASYSDKTSPPRPLPFGTGYNWRQNDSNLLLAHRTKLVQE